MVQFRCINSYQPITPALADKSIAIRHLTYRFGVRVQTVCVGINPDGMMLPWPGFHRRTGTTERDIVIADRKLTERFEELRVHLTILVHRDAVLNSAGDQVQTPVHDDAAAHLEISFER